MSGYTTLWSAIEHAEIIVIGSVASARVVPPERPLNQPTATPELRCARIASDSESAGASTIGGMPYTVTEVAVQEILKGSTKGRTAIDVLQTGGCYRDVFFSVGCPICSLPGDIVLFLRNGATTGESYYALLDPWIGAWSLDGESGTLTPVHPSPWFEIGTLNVLRDAIEMN